MTYQKEITVIRELAGELKDVSERPQNSVKRQKWANHNELMPNTEPVLWVCPDDDGGWLELVPENTLVCTDPDLRSLELRIRKYLYHAGHFNDDFVFEPVVYYDIPGKYTGYHYGNRDQKQVWGLHIEPRVAGKNAYHLDNFLKTPCDFDALLQHEVDFIPDEAELARLREKLGDAVDGILSVAFNLPYSVLVQSLLIELVHMRGLEELLYDLCDNEDLLMRVLEHMSQSKARLLERLEKNRMLFDNRTNIYTGSGGLGYTHAPVKKDREVQLKDMWGFADAQEFSHVSPRMFEAFAVQNQKAGLNKFGMGCYGCCEPLDNKYDILFRNITNLRRISVSPWSDTGIAAENIGKKAIYSWKPNPSTICCGFDEDTVCRLLRNVAETTRNCTTEIILKDIRTCMGTPVHLQKFIELVRKAFS